MLNARVASWKGHRKLAVEHLLSVLAPITTAFITDSFRR